MESDEVTAPARLLTARLRSGEELLEHYIDDLEHGGIFVPTRKILEPGDAVVVDMRIPLLRDRMLLRGEVAWRRRGQRRAAVRAGLGISFPASEQRKVHHLLRLARGEADPAAAQRRHERLPVSVPVDWRVPSQTDRHPSSLEDIGTGGAFIRTAERPPAGTSVVLELVPPGALSPQPIEGRVAWERKTPGAEGFGVEFRCRDIGGMRRLRELIRRIRSDQVEAFH
jgi:Tfp pilus assembly protein PilZ